MKFQVLSEDETIDAALAGRNIARVGDGEINVALGFATKSQEASTRLQRILCELLIGDGPALPCIPRVTLETVNRDRWVDSVMPKFTRLARPSVTFGSAFISRADVSPWIDTPQYWDKVISLWRGKDVVLLRGANSSSLTAKRVREAKSVEEITAPSWHAFNTDFDRLYRRLRVEKNRTVLMCLGSTATALAWELAKDRVHALDLGYIGMYLKKPGEVCET